MEDTSFLFEKPRAFLTFLWRREIVQHLIDGVEFAGKQTAFRLVDRPHPALVDHMEDFIGIDEDGPGGQKRGHRSPHWPDGRPLRVVGGALYDDDRDVVFAAVGVGLVYESVARFFRRYGGIQNLYHAGVAYHFPETVRA